MDETKGIAARDANGRFLPGQSGNPAGKTPGTRNRATILREALQDGEAVAAARIVIDKALAGDAVAARFIVDRLEPRQRGRTIALDLPDGTRATDILVASNATVAAMASGEITPDEALMVTRVLDGRLRALKAARRERAGEGGSNRTEPSPSGRGLGEGRRHAFAGSDDDPSGRLHPGPLPKGEGVILRPPYLSSRKREAARARNSIARLLHSTCISTPASTLPGTQLGERVAAFS